MSDIRRWERRARALFGGAIAVALLWPCVSLVRETTSHDWYGAVKLTVTEAMIAAGFNPQAVTHYRGPDGTVFRITRLGLTAYGVPIEARERIRYTALVGALHGGVAGALWVVLGVMLWRAVDGWRVLRAERSVRSRGRALQGDIESWEPPGMAEGLPAKAAGDARVALWVLPASEAARLIEALGAVENPQSVPAQRSVERAKIPLLAPADTAGAAADTAGANADSAGTKAESAIAKPKTGGAPAQPAKAKAGGGGQRRASSEPPAPDSEDELPEPDDGGKLNWI